MIANKELDSTVAIESEIDIVKVRRLTRDIATEIGFGITDITRIVTAASELARNVFVYAGSGIANCQELRNDEKTGIELKFEDSGPGIENIEQAMQENYSTSRGLGMGLPGTKRLMDEMEIESQIGKGTKVTIRKWLR